jgi:hypothetical protein
MHIGHTGGLEYAGKTRVRVSSLNRVQGIECVTRSMNQPIGLVGFS